MKRGRVGTSSTCRVQPAQLFERHFDLILIRSRRSGHEHR